MSIELPDLSAAPKRDFRKLAIGACATLLLVGGLFAIFSHHGEVPLREDLQCAQTAKIYPQFEEKGLANSSIFTTPEYEEYSLDLLAGAIQIPTVSFDDMLFDVEKDPRFVVFHDLHKYFARKFPLATKYRETVNTYGLLYTIPGSNPDLKPFVLMAHLDVVPVPAETLDEWDHPPFSGKFDGKKLFGRGSCDTKNTLVAIHEATEALLEQDWQPERTLLLSFGFDEEIQGFRGARKLAELIEQRYGKDGVEMLVDEGSAIFDQYGAYFAMPAVAEKGRVNFKFTFNTPGGHSSAPPDHTGIGLAAELVTRLEDDVPLPATLNEKNVAQGMFACFGQHGTEISTAERELFTNLQSPVASNALAQQLASDRMMRILVETTQAIDIIHGGVKVNALPEQVTVEVNFRVKPDSSVELETQRVKHVVTSVAEDFELGANFTNSFENLPSVVLRPESPKGFLHMETTDVLHVAPTSPYYNDTHWDLLSGTTKHVIEDVALHFDASKPLHMGPMLMTGNTDTAHYWNLTKNIYRFFPALMSDLENIHTVNEAIAPRSHYSTVIFFYELLINMDAELS